MSEREPGQHSEMRNVAPIPEQKQEERGWTVELNGEKVEQVTSLKLEQGEWV